MAVLKLLVLTFLISIPSFAQEMDEIAIPTPGDDLVLTSGYSAQEYFGSRARPSSCRTEWGAAWKWYEELKSQLKVLLASHAEAGVLDAKEAEISKFKTTSLLKLTEACGPCSSQEVSTKTVYAPTGLQEWFITDGSCYFPHDTKEKQNAAFDKAVAFLGNTASFAKHHGGFESILEFMPIDRATGTFLPHVSHMASGTSLDAYIAVRGPGRIAFNYLFENRINLVESPDGIREFIIQFTGLPRPSGFDPKIYDINLSGTKKNISFRWDISRVKGMWYVRNDGYFRYFTAADFETPLNVGTSFARTTLLDTVMTLAERGE